MANIHIIPHKHQIDKAARNEQKKHQSKVLWFTGLSGSGKSTLANAVEQALFAMGYNTYILDGDNIRTGLCKDLSFSDADRQENIRRIGEVAKLMSDAGIIVLSAFVSPFKADRDRVRSILPEGDFIEIFVNCPLEVCEQRDVKGLYKKARNGEIKDFTGITSPFEAPLSPSLEIKTAEQDLATSTEAVLNYILPLIKQ